MTQSATASAHFADRPVVFIHTNAKQRLGALVSAHSFRRNARQPEGFEVRLLEAEHSAPLRAAEGRSFLRAGHSRIWRMDDLQSFTPLRFAVPDAMGHQGLALVVDPDVFAVGDVGELFARDREGKAIWCRARPGHNGAAEYLATSVMLLDCARLPHWRFGPMLEDLLAKRLDYVELIELRREKRETIGLLESVWNDFDRMEADTRLLHTTKRRTQPWKTGLKVDFTVRERGFGPIPAAVVRPLLRLWTSQARYKPHPDKRQEAFFFAMLAECLDEGSVTRAEVEHGIREKHIRPDALALADRCRGQFPRPLSAAAA
ncbi:hypothetical protein MVG78_21415 (plasmid) [Roseomonas gilardii subsp. gilardii]|uniref:hypothetical protein n=1 Tax=Roseomonas gilardii TaxID=257708 RepID=UPI001FFC0BF6|nr:hypothetical protein [Roseomonas gilardii]UPG74641.1 hypothetical protein MVG78_21415 [Roseomonas gilardii subsp. gilardii]